MADPAPDQPGVIAPPPLIALGALIVGLGLDHLLAGGFGGSRMTAGVLGGALTLFGIGLIVGCAALFRRAGTNVQTRRAATAIVSTGPYRLSRNPIYAGLLAAQAGLSLVFDAPWALLGLLVTAPMLHWGVVLREERYLAAKFPEEYGAYRAQVRRWL